MKFLTKNKKMFALIALICFAVTLVSNLISAGSTIIGSFDYMFESFGMFLLAAVGIISAFVGLLVPVCYGGSAFFVWKKDNHMKLLAVGAVLVIINMFLSIVSQVISSIVYDYFNIMMFLPVIIGYFLPFVFAAYLIVFSLIKVKGPAVPIAGAAILVLMLGSGVLGGIASFISNVINLFDYFSWEMVWYTITSLLGSSVSLLSNIGLLLLVPAAFYIPKDEELEVVEEENEEEVIAEEPAIEEIQEAPAAE